MARRIGSVLGVILSGAFLSWLLPLEIAAALNAFVGVVAGAWMWG